jgi:alkaline phosphatase D
MTTINQLTVGPIVGHAGTDQVRIWGRAKFEPMANGQPRRAFGIARIKTRTRGSYSSPVIFKMNPNFDLTGIAIFQDLQPGKEYVYQIGWFYSDKEITEFARGARWDWTNTDQGQFSTASDDDDAERQFVFGSCRYLLRLFGGAFFESRGDKTFRSILEQIKDGTNIDKLLMVGDQIYADDLNFVSPDKQVDEFLARYRDVFSQPNMKKLMSQVSTYMTLDDHEIEDNWPSEASGKDYMMKYPAAMHAYQAYQASHSPLLELDAAGNLKGTPSHFYYRFTDGCCDFFVTDSRTEREPQDQEMIGDEQMQSLLDWLDDGSGRVKMVVTSVPFFPDTKKHNDDKWSGYPEQRDQIIEHIKSNNIAKVVFLSGDVHCSMAAELDISDPGASQLKIYSVISSAFYWPYPHMKRRKFQLQGHVASVTDPQAYRLGQVSDVYSSDNFSRVRVNHQDLSVEVFDRKGRPEHAISFEF